MIEYRLYNLNETLKTLFEEMGVFVAEEDFAGKKSFLVYSQDDISDILKDLGETFDAKDVEETGWQEKWKEFVKEDWLTEDFYFIFEPKKFSDCRKTVYINPALAFGTGAHPTTQIAARLLEKVALGKSVLDVGTGSGILSILAEKCGAENIEALDIDKDALPNCLENIENNRCFKIKAVSGDISMYETKTFDIVVANIISSVLNEISSYIFKIAKEYIIFSGILESEYNNVVLSLTPKGAVVVSKLIIGDWTGMLIKLKG